MQKKIDISNGLYLKELHPKDAPELFRVTIDNRYYLANYLPWAKHVDQVTDSLNFINENIQKRTNGEEYSFGIINNGQIIGHISLMHVKDGKTPEIGYWVSEIFAGRGVATDAALAVTNFGFQLAVPEILIRADVNNVASNRVAEKLGYNLIDTRQDEDGHYNYWIREK